MLWNSFRVQIWRRESKCGGVKNQNYIIIEPWTETQQKEQRGKKKLQQQRWEEKENHVYSKACCIKRKTNLFQYT